MRERVRETESGREREGGRPTRLSNDKSNTSRKIEQIIHRKKTAQLAERGETEEQYVEMMHSKKAIH